MSHIVTRSVRSQSDWSTSSVANFEAAWLGLCGLTQMRGADSTQASRRVTGSNFDAAGSGPVRMMGCGIRVRRDCHQPDPIA